MTESGDLAIGLDALADWFSRLFTELDAMNSDFVDLLEQGTNPADDVTDLARIGRAGIERRVQRFLLDHPSADGAGVIFTRSRTATHEGVLEWWKRDDANGVARQSFGVNPTHDRFYDYEQLEWFVTPFRSGRHWITGPYIDYLGIDEYVVTLTTRTVVHGRPIGVTGIDMRMADFERALTPLIHRVPAPAALLSSHYSVLVGNSSRFITGDRIERVPSGFHTTRLDAAGATLYVVHR
ncbi:hypothetical protein [Nocardia sp. NPDC004860]|uniref:PDC sensor domain-containing protein n=1 Tax=Nocardia sp. NPDC004860 TaxID=3154557 RepID=UPI0033B6B940